MSAAAPRDPHAEPPIPSAPVPSRAVMLFLFTASGVWTLLVAVEAIGIVWLVAGPVLTVWSWLIWAMIRQRRHARR